MNAPTNVMHLQRGDTAHASGDEINASASSARERAKIEARYIMAMRRPRDWMVVRTSMLDECRRPDFANSKRTYYIKPGVANAHGLGIGFVEMAIRAMTNIAVDKQCIYDSEDLETYLVTVTDLETNNSFEDEVKVFKTVERSRALDDGSFISRRKNSSGNWTYLVPTTNEDDLANKRAALISKSLRVSGLKHLPDWVKDDCISEIYRVRRDETARDPDAAKKRMIDCFALIQVTPADLSLYLGHDLMSITPDEIVQMRGIYDAITSGDGTWASFVEAKNNPEESGGSDQDSQGQTKKSTGVARPLSKSEAAKAAAPEVAAQNDAGQAAPPPPPAPADAPAQPAAEPAAPTSPPASEGSRKFLLNKFKAQPSALLAALLAAGYVGAMGKTDADITKIVDGGNPESLAGLTDAQFAMVKAQLPKP